MGRLFTIGDSISQGFRSGGTAFTENAYSTYLAQALGVNGYRRLQWPKTKLKIDLEGMMRMLEKRFGTDIGALEWLPIYGAISDFQDQSEDFYERGEGGLDRPMLNYNYDFTDNCAVEGMRVADAWEVTPSLCKKRIKADRESDQDNPGIKLASSSFYRAALKVLNPRLQAQYDEYSAISWLEHVAQNEGVDNTIVFLGANNALGTIFKVKFEPKDLTPGEAKTFGSKAGAVGEENKFTLWHPTAFEHDYSLLLAKVNDAMANNKTKDWKVFLGTVPIVTIAAMIEGFGEERLVDDPRVPLGKATRQFRYYQYYKYYGVNESTALQTGKIMAFRDALFIDKVIIAFNKAIVRLADEMNNKIGRKAFIVVDISNALTDMAWKRNSGMPSYEYPEELQWLYPPINTKYYRADSNRNIVDGGIFSLDGIHPTVIGQGIIAHEFLKAMKENGAASSGAALNWKSIISDDELRSDPLPIIDSMVNKWQAIDFIVNAIALAGML